MTCIKPGKGKGVISFTRGARAPEVFRIRQLKECAKALLEREGSVVLQYYPTAGLIPLRRWLADRYDVGMDGVLVSNGSIPILEFLNHLLTSPGDVVFVEKPS